MGYDMSDDVFCYVLSKKKNNYNRSNMGYDIEIVMPRKNEENGELETSHFVGDEYISGNWSASTFSRIFHVADIHGYNGKYIADVIQKALSRLHSEEGYDPTYEPKVDVWGQALDKRVTDAWRRPDEYRKDQICMFGHILERFLKKARKYPKAHWFTDSPDFPSEFLFPDGESFECDDDGAASSSSYVIPFRHPVHGNIMISSYKGSPALPGSFVRSSTAIDCVVLGSALRKCSAENGR